MRSLRDMAPSSIKLQPESIALEVLFEDPWLIAVNKAAGMVVHPTYKHSSGTLVNAILGHRFLHATPGVVTRLDKDTSGVVLVALTSQIHMMVQKDAHAGGVKKEYLAVVHGSPEPRQGTIALPLARSPEDRRRVVPAADGASCETRYEVIAGSTEYSLLRCELMTGRTHQIRVHLAASGWPIVGDPVYGRAHPLLARQALHAWRITLPHPITRVPLVISAPVPDDMRVVMPLDV
jgi:23S rRNA pseudouridine1911/1915/1917 synthase